MAVHNIIDWLPVFLRGVQFQLRARGEGFRHIRQRNPILRALRPGKARLDIPHIQFQRTGENRFIARVSPHPLRFGIGFDQLNLLLATAA